MLIDILIEHLLKFAKLHNLRCFWHESFGKKIRTSDFFVVIDFEKMYYYHNEMFNSKVYFELNDPNIINTLENALVNWKKIYGSL